MEAHSVTGDITVGHFVSKEEIDYANLSVISHVKQKLLQELVEHLQKGDIFDGRTYDISITCRDEAVINRMAALLPDKMVELSVSFQVWIHDWDKAEVGEHTKFSFPVGLYHIFTTANRKVFTRDVGGLWLRTK